MFIGASIFQPRPKPAASWRSGGGVKQRPIFEHRQFPLVKLR
jgi:hypothetical protein